MDCWWWTLYMRPKYSVKILCLFHCLLKGFIPILNSFYFRHGKAVWSFKLPASKIKRNLLKNNISTYSKSIRPLSNFLNSGKDITRNSLASGVYSIPCSCGKFYVGRTHQQFVVRFIEPWNSIENALKFAKSPESFTSTWAKHIFFNLDHFVQFEEAIAISNDKVSLSGLLKH